MKNLKKLMVLSVAALTLAACGGSSSESESGSGGEGSSSRVRPSVYVRAEDEDVFDANLGAYEALLDEANKEQDIDVRYVKYAKAEAFLLDSAVMIPTTTQGGTYGLTRAAPRTIPFSMWGNDTDRLKNCVVVNYDSNKPFIKGAERNEMIEQWNAAREGNGIYDPKAYLTGKGYSFDNVYKGTFTADPETIDILSTSYASDTEQLVNAIEGLLEYDNLGQLQPRLAKALPTVSADGKTYTFEIRDDAYWYTSQGQQYQAVKADDFVAGFQHMLDAAGGLEWLCEGVIKNVSEYLAGEVGFEEVGYRQENGKVVIELVKPEPFFTTRLTYSCFMPMNRDFYVSRGGKFGLEYDPTEVTYTYGKVGDLASMVYNSAFRPTKIEAGTQIVYTKNAGYYDADKVNFSTLNFTFDGGDNPMGMYDSAVAGDLLGYGLGVTSGTLEKAKQAGLFDDYHYVTFTNATTYFAGLNLNRGTWDVASVHSFQSELQKVINHEMIQSANVRRAIQHAWDRAAWNGVTTGEELKNASLRNMYTAPEFVSISKAVEFEGKSYAANTTYGDIVERMLKEDFNRVVEVEDGQDGWYNVAEAQKYLAAAKAEFGDYWATPHFEIVYQGDSESSTATARAFKMTVEASLNNEIIIDLVSASNRTDYLKAGYRASNGEAGCFDIFYGSGWGPDYGDPSTYLDTFRGDGAGYMTKTIGLF